MTDDLKGQIEDLDSLRKDALRYRWLRDEATEDWAVLVWDIFGDNQTVEMKRLDTAIDAAMQGKTE